MASSTPIEKKTTACLKKSVGSTKNKKVKLKNILCGENIQWPKPSKDVEQDILSKLSETLKSLPNIFKPVKSSSNKDQEGKRKIRAQLELGTNSVLRALEKDRLACVLVSAKVTPAAAIDPLVAVALERGCPLLCLESLATTLAKVTKSKCFPVCIGFKNMVTSSRADFVDLISLIKENTHSHSALRRRLVSTKKVAGHRKELPESLRPVSLDANTDEAVREDLKRVFSKAAFKSTETKAWTSKDKKRKKHKIKKRLKEYYQKWFHIHFESGLKTVTEYVGQGKISLVLIIPDLVPILMGSPSTSSLLCVARDADCPVLCISNLSSVLCARTEKALACLGIKKESCLPMNTTSAFSTVMEKCHNFMRTAPMPTQEMDIEADGEDKEDTAIDEDGDKDEENNENEDYSFLYIKKKDSSELKERALKLMKEKEESSKQLTFTSDFISLKGEYAEVSRNPESNTNLGKRKHEKTLPLSQRQPKKVLLDTKDSSSLSTDSKKDEAKSPQQTNVSSNTSGFISFGSSLSPSSKQAEDVDMSLSVPEDEKNSPTGTTEVLFSISKVGDKTKVQSKENVSVKKTSLSSEQSSNVLGFDSTKSDRKEDEHVLNVFSATSTKNKGEDKRRHGQEGFVSFAYTEANIHTLQPNPNRKKKKRGKK